MASYTYQSTNIQQKRKVNQGSFLKRNWFEFLILIGLFYLLLCRDVHLTIGYKAPDQNAINTESLSTADMNPFGLLTGQHQTSAIVADQEVLEPLQGGVVPASLNELEKGRLEKCYQFIERFAKVAIAEQEKYGIPASVLLGQALVASKAGESKLTLEANNYFYQLCSGSNSCHEEGGVDYRKFASPWESFRSQSLYLSSSFQKALAHNSDGKSFAHALYREGYYSNQSEVNKLIEVIESLDLFLFDGTSNS